ncbi:MAG: ABC transporter ATP-binding protein/permease [Anaerolineales bacterium]|nr:ABC transporter ATP-binding protein/permease [Anaerolineales bacterium]
MAGSVICGLLFAGTNLIPPLLIRQLIQWITEASADSSDLIRVTFALLGLYLIRGATRYGYGYFSHVTAYRVMHNLMVRVYRHMQRQPHRFFNYKQTGSLISASINDIESVEDFIAHGIPETILATILPFSMIVVLFVLNPQLALIVLVPIPLASWLVYRYLSRARRMWRVIRENLANLVALVQDNLSGIAVIKAFSQENRRAELVEEKSMGFRDGMLRVSLVGQLPMGIIELAGGLGIVLVIWMGGSMALIGHTTVADLFVFIVYMGHIYQPFLTLASINDVLQKAAASVDRVFALLAEKPDIVDPPGALVPHNVDFSIAFDKVTFGYEPDATILHEVTFDVSPGEIVALVGPTGAGKTTISALIPRFWDVQSGTVTVANHDVRTLQLEFLRRNVASVLQDVFLFHGTVLENVLFGRPEASNHEVIDAVKAANAEEFIINLPDGFETVVGERGVRLSGGQKQRLSIARALLKDAPILILDEATSSVDAETESLIQEAITRLASNRTSVIIAHRLSTIRSADKIIVLDDGRIVESGTNHALMAANGLYARMVQSQDLNRDWRIHRDVDEIVTY